MSLHSVTKIGIFFEYEENPWKTGMQPECESYNTYNDNRAKIQYSKGDRFSILNTCNPHNILLLYKSIVAMGDVFEEAKDTKPLI